MPLRWAQVTTGLDPKRFALRSAPDLLAASKAWQGYDAAASSVKAAIANLARKSG
jgi:bifunctional non-homologous end joining protein LigD